ncbi:hypothetical protein BBJ29_006590 [Phytophthora kernoviae]|uniref:Uncharacterized protein n=1 Tax=Phytophthora kernoviae TaxID=325452 RepID=A0A3F2RFY9_9STRA|nr:hypothetical protein BBP00_00008250 [Phytophthora kernoviae]RLN63273.1 hypothetical protein BBJ29_006590 [Phytophthora kernoviae]
MPLAHLPSLGSSQPQHHPVLPPLRASHQLNQHFPLSQPQPQSQQYSPPSYYQQPMTPSVDIAAASSVDLTLSAQQLHCDPMRISKKLLPGSVFAGIKINPKIGRRAYYPCAQDSPAAARSKESAACHLMSLRQAFIQSIEEEEQALEAATNSSTSPTYATKPSSTHNNSAIQKTGATLSRKRSYDDVVRAQQQQQQRYLASVELAEPQIFYHFQRQTTPALFCLRYSAAANAAASTTATTPVMCKLPKLTVTDDVSRRASCPILQRSVSPVTVATSSAVLPPLRVSLVRASMC